jgi:hypothetical protein
LQLGQKASVTLQGRASSVEGAVTFVSPQVNPMTRTAVARIAIPNPAMTLKPGMFATVEIQVPISGEAVTIPREAVIDTGVRQIVFIARDGGRFEPRPVRMGLETDGRVQILSGLDAGERVVTSGQFLLDSESRMREAIQKMTSERLLQPPSRTGPRSDAVLKPYLEVARRLAADQPVPATTLDALEQGARALGMELPDMRGQPIAAQRDAFRKVSESIIDLTARHRSSVKLYVLHCPMAHARWIQDSDTIANPYFGSGMLECGEVVSTIEAVAP